MRQISFKLQ